MPTKIEFPAETQWDANRGSLLFRAIVDGSRTVVCLLPYEVASAGDFDGRDRAKSTRTYFDRYRSEVEDAGRRIIEESPDQNEIVIPSQMV